MLDTVLVVVIVFLVVILVVPAVTGAIRRVAKRRAQRPAPPPPQPRAPLPETAKIPAVQAPPAAPVRKPTVAIPMPAEVQDGGAPSSGATEMVQWYGMLLCTAGPLNGQAFVVEPDGIYIGRDEELSQVVVRDARVSKRHLRILPRGGKVYAIDQGSTNGTFLGDPAGERVTEVPLKRGDVLVLADGVAAFTFQI